MPLTEILFTMKKNLQLLLVEDDVDLHDSIKTLIQSMELKCISAYNGQEAMDLLKQHQIGLVLSDVKMPKVDGIQLFEHIKSNYSIPVIIMTGFSEVMDIHKAHELGVSYFLSKPFIFEELERAIELFTDKTHEVNKSFDADYCRIPAGEFISGSELKVDLYLRLNESKYIKIATKKARINGDQLRNYISRGLKFLYIKKEEFPLYVGVNLRVARVATEQTSITPGQKLKLLKHTAESLLQDTYINGVTKEKHDEAREVVMNTISTLSEDGDISKLLLLLNEHSDHLYAHSLGVSVYSTLVGKEVGWGSTTSQFKIAMAGMLHDIGKKELPHELVDKARKDFTAEELKLYETHTIRGKDILSRIHNVPSDIAIVATQHHENLIGRGYPNRLKKDQIHPLARLISAVDAFIDLVMKTNFYEGMDTNEAFDRILALNSNEYEALFLAGLMKVFNYPIPSAYVEALKYAKKIVA